SLFASGSCKRRPVVSAIQTWEHESDMAWAICGPSGRVGVAEIGRPPFVEPTSAGEQRGVRSSCAPARVGYATCSLGGMGVQTHHQDQHTHWSGIQRYLVRTGLCCTESNKPQCAWIGAGPITLKIA